MCGICGQFNYGTNEPIDVIGLKRMTQAMQHRGPDDEGFYVKNNIGLGFRRLSIIDLEAGHQPMSDREEMVWVVFNGEIYNHPELRVQLEKLGHVFRTRSDTEIIVHGYKQWGKDVLQYLNGMFGLAIWDDRNKELMLARDRMGIKPLYYKLNSHGLYFASDLRAILECDGKYGEVDPTAINFIVRYRHIPSPLTMFSGYKKLAAGTSLTVKLNQAPQVERWYGFKPTPFDPMPKAGDAKEALLALYRKAVKRQLISDVPVGLLLSGGLDSSLLLALMNESGMSWQTFTIGFGGSFADDELSDAAQTAKLLNANHVSYQLNRETFESSLPKVISFLEEPIAAPPAVLMYLISQRAREDVKVALIGQGPDELLGGYKRHLGVRYGNYWRLIPPELRNQIRNAIRYLPRCESIKRGLYSLDSPDRMRRYQQVISIIPENLAANLFQEDILSENSGAKMIEMWSDLMPLMAETDELGGLQFLEVRCTLPDELLIYADKVSMANGLEVRVPYLDHEIVEYVERLSATFCSGSHYFHNNIQDYLKLKLPAKKAASSLMRQPC